MMSAARAPKHDPTQRQTLSLQNDRAEIESLHATVLERARHLGYPEAARFAIRLALEEAIANAFQHGQQGRPEGFIDVTICPTRDEIRITVSDHGDGFNPAVLADPTAPENLDKPAGRGVMLMRAYMHRVEFNAKGNKVTLIAKPVQRAAKTAPET